MSSIWTPSGEYRPEPEPTPGSDAGSAGGAGGSPAGMGAPPSGAFDADDISPEQIAAVLQMQAQIRATPAAAIVANHVIQLFELALVYLGLGTPPDEQGRIPMPDLAQAGVVIDAMNALVEGLGSRYGEDEQTLRDAVGQIQMLYVQAADALQAATES